MSEVDQWIIELAESGSDQAAKVEAAIDILAEQGPPWAGHLQIASRDRVCTT